MTKTERKRKSVLYSGRPRREHPLKKREKESKKKKQSICFFLFFQIFISSGTFDLWALSACEALNLYDDK